MATQTVSPSVDADLRLPPLRNLSEDEFLRFCAQNEDYRIERAASGAIIIMAPTGFEPGNREVDLVGQLYVWNLRTKRGRVVGPSAGFTLPNGAIRAADCGFVLQPTLDAIPAGERERFAHVVPEFVVELRSPTDSLRTLQLKMEEYIENGVLLGWLIDPTERAVWIYRSGREAERLADPKTVDGEGPVAGFVLSLDVVWPAS